MSNVTSTIFEGEGPLLLHLEADVESSLSSEVCHHWAGFSLTPAGVQHVSHGHN